MVNFEQCLLSASVFFNFIVYDEHVFGYYFDLDIVGVFKALPNV